MVAEVEAEWSVIVVPPVLLGVCEAVLSDWVVEASETVLDEVVGPSRLCKSSILGSATAVCKQKHSNRIITIFKCIA